MISATVFHQEEMQGQCMDAPEIPIHNSDGEEMGIIFPKISEDCGEMDFLYQWMTWKIAVGSWEDAPLYL